ncbi:ParA family protein [Desulfobotulus sp. H1]|uniref:ParA family protein n=1 Tax=Desulfobotulus pelophilus TaxID=2823377 RepID=A0ABT3N9F6_9BACT|nr:ParA family protein [Desulfobotulus pelophilus]MCW7754079.1 ParA family protein [Desulfobotulus pelophilus]
MVSSVMHSVFCFINHNRDTGKTATVRNIAAAMALSGKQVLAVFPPAAACHEGWSSSLSVGNEMAEDEVIKGLYFLTPDFGFPEEDLSWPMICQKIETILTSLPADMVVLLDTPSAFSAFTRAGLFLARGGLIPLQLDASSFDRLGPTLGLLEWVRREKQQALPLLGMIPVRVRPQQSLSRIFSGPALSLFRAKMAPFPVPEDPLVSRAELNGKPVFYEDILSPSAKSYGMLAAWIGRFL